eukprot:TRINITY_DN51122_c0_g1_i1.p1 TRINITY_DN51122_c0_g1~~TRINITY_DN51122_c0_g1_i1.p1  ORF type:complete len:142 (-),score=28.40 TRINITY_DN51122_c0_g1_i1:67-492(-)
MEGVIIFSRRVQALQDNIQKQLLPLEKKTAHCVLDCYNIPADYDSIHRCGDSCEQAMQKTSRRISAEFEFLQNSVQDCQKNTIRRLEPGMEAARFDPVAQRALSSAFEEGAIRCYRDAEPFVPVVEARVKSILSQIPQIDI